MDELLAMWAEWLRPSAGLPTVQWSLLLALAAAAGHLLQRYTGLPKVVGYSIVGTLAGLAGFSGAAWPLQGVALFLDPVLTKDVDNKWGPGADFDADGLVYLGNSNVVTDGNTSSANSKCTKFVMNGFTTNGSVKLDFAQQNCAALGLKQWGGIVVHLTK